MQDSERAQTTVCVDSWEAVPLTPKLRRDYAAFREAVLKAGRFSVFEATETAWRARLFTDLCNDPTIETDISCGFPWTLVRERPAPVEIGGDDAGL